MADRYNGWANYQTWNIALWINNDEGLYNAAREFVKQNKDSIGPNESLYRKFIREMELEGKSTPDKVAFNDSGLDLDELDDMMKELVAE